MKPFVQIFSSLVCLLMLAFFVTTTTAAVAPVKPGKSAAQLVGTWQLISYNYIGLRQILAPNKACLKFITPTHYTWVYYHTSTKQMLATGGGRYFLLSENKYTEKVDFLQQAEVDFRSAAYKNCHTRPSDMEQLYWADKCLHVEVNGDKMNITQTLANGYIIQETWQRVK